MNVYKSLVVAIDLVGTASQVLAKVVDLVKDQPTKITLLSVSDLPLPMQEGGLGENLFIPYDLNISEDTIREKSLAKMEELMQEVGLSVDQLTVEFGRPANVIVEVAEREKADLIVVGSHGRHGIDLLLGSTANGVLHRAQCDVLAVRLDR